MSETKVEVEFNKIWLQTVTSRNFTSSELYQFIYTDDRILTYLWNNHMWNTELLTPHTSLIDPPSHFTLPITQPNTQGRDTKYLEHFQCILLEPDLLMLNSSYHNSMDSSVPPTLVNTPQSSPPSTPELVYWRAWELTFPDNHPDLCFCGIDICHCNSHHPTYPTWNPPLGPPVLQSRTYRRSPLQPTIWPVHVTGEITQPQPRNKDTLYPLMKEKDTDYTEPRTSLTANPILFPLPKFIENQPHPQILSQYQWHITSRRSYKDHIMHYQGSNNHYPLLPIVITPAS